MVLWLRRLFLELRRRVRNCPIEVSIYPTRRTVCAGLNPRSHFRLARRVPHGDPTDGRLTDPESIVIKLHLNWGRAPAQQLGRVSPDPSWGNVYPATCVDEVLEQRGVCRAFDKAPHAPAAGASTAAAFNEKLQADLSFLGGVTAAHVLAAPSKYPLLMPARTETPQEVRGAFCGCWVGACRLLMCV